MSKGLAREFASGQVRELTEVELDCVGGGAPRHFFIDHFQKRQSLKTSAEVIDFKPQYSK
ncbi:hypothetical protein [Xylella taiwanensis]|nr:hypothetical protein [Xylella taiwanensis]MCD8455689.1 hypothetical protein [Xylella taiwanensis]MCD8458096.1 hypothetical protein [Xylella taiwanensis]MCD8463711.1 hypothetical protein [Xylella taiwanensis]UFS48616.1 hypothetical protein LPH54_06095 [Xylella taiwanensis]UFS50907.1 hypothetical protein LPH56_06105 [Xylella taiwanensis]